VPQTTVLVVDDEEGVRETIAEALGLYGYGVVAAASVEEAEAALQRLGAERIHLVITDVHLTPGPGARVGYVMAQRWRALHPGLPIMLISGNPSNQDLPEVRAGAMRFLLKPFRIEVLLEAVRDAIGR
jgi:DNA-binding NtrC family response regulator